MRTLISHCKSRDRETERLHKAWKAISAQHSQLLQHVMREVHYLALENKHPLTAGPSLPPTFDATIDPLITSKNAQIQAMLKSAGLPVSGTKHALITRYREHKRRLEAGECKTCALHIAVADAIENALGDTESSVHSAPLHKTQTKTKEEIKLRLRRGKSCNVYS